MRRRWPLALLAVWGTFGCPDRDRSAPADGGRSAAALRVPIPAGWQANAQGSLLEVGRAGDVVLVIRRESHAAGRPLPTPAELRAAFAAGAGGSSLRVIREEAREDVSFLALELGGREAKGLAFLGVKRLGEDWFLCRSRPGRTEEELQIAVAACRGLEWR